MVRRIVGITGISLWAGLIAIAVLGAFRANANGEQMFENLPEGWKVEKSFVVSKAQTMAISRRLGSRISKLTNTVLSIEGKRLQVNVFYCPTPNGADKIYKQVLEAHNGHTGHLARQGNLVIEFAKSDDIELMGQVRQALGLEAVKLDIVAGKLIKKIPAGWRIENSFVVPRDQTAAIGKKLGGRIKNLSNTIFSVQGKRFQVNVIECVTPAGTEKIHKSILKMKGDPAFCLKLGNSVVEFVGGDVGLAKKAVYELGIKPGTGEAKEKQISKGGKLETMAKDFMDLLVKGNYAKAVANFDGKMTRLMPAEKLEEVWDSIIAKAGPCIEQLGVRREKILQYDVVFVTCKYEKVVLDTRVVFDRNKQIAGLSFIRSKEPARYQAPGYVRRDSFGEREVRVGKGPMALPGTLSIPKGQGPFPAMVLVHGSGPQDRDGSIGPNKPFRDLACGLASRGIAVLRYDKRTKAFPAQMTAIVNKLTVKEETIDDALAAVALLRKTGQIDTNKIFVLGHSFGGFVIPRIGKLDSKIAGFIVMAGTVRPLEDVILDQLSYVLSVDGIISKAEKTELEKLKRQIAKVKDPTLSPTSSASDLPLGAPAAYWLDLRGYNPAEMAKELACPMLILQGGRDYQVIEADFQLWRKALSSRNNVKFKWYDNLNHLFVEGEGKSTPAEYGTAGNVAQIVIEDIEAWIKKLQ